MLCEGLCCVRGCVVCGVVLCVCEGLCMGSQW